MTGPLTIGGVPPGTTSNNFLNIALPYIGVAGINCQNTNTGTTAVCEFTVSGSDSTSISNYGGFYRINIGATGHGVVVGGPGDVGLQSAGNNLQISPVNANLYLNYGADVNSMTPAISISSSGVIAFPELAASSGHVCVHLDTSGIMTNTGTDCSSGGGSGTVSSGTLYQEAGYSAAGTTVSGATPIHVNASRISGFVSDGSTDVTSVLQTWLTGNCRILDIPWDGVTGHCAEISSPLQITCAGGGIWGSGKSTSGNGGLCTKKPNIDLIQPYNAGGDPGAISIHNMNLSYTGTAASGATATATVSTGAGAAVTGFTVTNGGTNYYATPGISVIGCNNVQVLATLSSGVITALSPASGSAAQGTLVSSGSTGSCINTASAAYQWVSAASYLRYHPIVVNVSGTNYVYEATTAVASATTQPSCTTLYCTSSDGSGVWTNEGVFGSVAIVGGSTGDSTGQASTGWGIDATGISSYNGAYLDIDNVSVWNMGGAVRANGASINRIHNVTGNTNQDGNGYCYANTAGSPQSDDLWGVSCTGSAGWSGYMSGQGYSATLTCIISCTQQIQYVN